MGFAIDKDVVEKYKKAGFIAGKALRYGAKLIKPGVSIVSVLDSVEEKIKELGGGIAFPAQISLNHVAAHYCSVDENEVFKEGDVVKLDVGAHIDGFVGDTALTVDLGDNKDLLSASRTALKEAIKVVKSGTKVSDIGSVIHNTITSFGFAPVRNLSGHGLDKFQVHSEPNVPNYNNNSNYTLKNGQVIAIEPFSSSGVGIVEEVSTATVFSLERVKPVRNPTSRRILKEIISFNGLPFTIRWFYKKYPRLLVDHAFNEFLRLGIVHDYRPLADVGKGLVAQFEHTMIVQENKALVTTMVDDD